uniref:Uncharacterized protein n=1 Tax=Siphoviridae sp. ctprd3 TaxID=2827943 RepID=A0A8S5TA40_9CAUD|nr:MAG TPA: hypothetical protein [Siphoviridae sp. ctprd3]
MAFLYSSNAIVTILCDFGNRVAATELTDCYFL